MFSSDGSRTRNPGFGFLRAIFFTFYKIIKFVKYLAEFEENPCSTPHFSTQKLNFVYPIHH